MKRAKRIALVLAVLAFPALTGCGSNSGSNPTTTAAVPAVVAVGGTNCINLAANTGNQTIGFTGSNAQFLGNAIEATQISVGGGAPGGSFSRVLSDGVSAISMNITVAGNNITSPIPANGYGYGYGYGAGTNNATVSGEIILGPDALGQIEEQVGYGYSYPGYSPYGIAPNTNATCMTITNMAINLGISGTTLYGGGQNGVYLYLSTGQPVHIEF